MRRLGPLVARLIRPFSPRSLRRQLTLALLALALLIVASNLTAVVALDVSARSTHVLAEARVARLHDAQDLVAGTLLVERESRRLISVGSMEEVQMCHTEIIDQLRTLDQLVTSLGKASGDISVLSLYQSNQLFRNATHILAGLKESALRAEAELLLSVRTHVRSPQTTAAEMLLLHRLGEETDPEEIERLREEFVREAGPLRLADDDPFSLRSRLVEQEGALHRSHRLLEGQSIAMVAAAQKISAGFTTEYRTSVDRLAETSRNTERWVLALLVGSLLAAWLVYTFLGRHVLARLQQVSDYLRRDGDAAPDLRVPVQGDDEIGEMARAVEQFMEDRRRLFAANRELESFSYSVAHDLRAPLRAINGYAGVLVESHWEELGEEGRRCLDVIRRNTLHMSELIEDLLKLSRVTRGEVVRAPVDMAALVRAAFEEARASAPERNIVLRVGELPNTLGDAALIRQALVNLLSNAVKFTAPRSEAVIEVDGCGAGEEVAYRVTDNGVGFDMRYVHKLFGVFERLHGTEEFEGTGIGLAIVKRIVERHGGRIWAEGRVGEGATFQFTLPRNGSQRRPPPARVG